MNRRHSKSSLGSMVVFILVMGCLSLIGLGTYIYVQDSKDTSVTDTGSTGGALLSPSEKDEGESNDISESEQQLKDFDDQVVNDVKTSLLEEMSSQTEEDDNTERLAINISFSNFDENNNTFRIGLAIINDPERLATSCFLSIEAVVGRVAAQKDNLTGQHNISGCSFNNISLAALSAPSQTQPWKVVVQGRGANNRVLVALEKDLTTPDDLNNLINMPSGVSYGL